MISNENIFYFFLFLFVFLLVLIAIRVFVYLTEKESGSPSPYTGQPLRFASEIHWLTAEKVLRFLYDMNDYYNPMFDLTNAALCRETGRLFPDAVTWYGSIKVDWKFLQKRFPGHFISWGSLTEEQKLRLKDKHYSLQGFQTDYSSSKPSPFKVETVYAMAKPGPLYVDINTGVLIGWQIVPGTDLEVLIVKRPKGH